MYQTYKACHTVKTDKSEALESEKTDRSIGSHSNTVDTAALEKRHANQFSLNDTGKGSENMAGKLERTDVRIKGDEKKGSYMQSKDTKHESGLPHKRSENESDPRYKHVTKEVPTKNKTESAIKPRDNQKDTMDITKSGNPIGKDKIPDKELVTGQTPIETQDKDTTHISQSDRPKQEDNTSDVMLDKDKEQITDVHHKTKDTDTFDLSGDTSDLEDKVKNLHISKMGNVTGQKEKTEPDCGGGIPEKSDPKDIGSSKESKDQQLCVSQGKKEEKMQYDHTKQSMISSKASLGKLEANDAARNDSLDMQKTTDHKDDEAEISDRTYTYVYKKEPKKDKSAADEDSLKTHEPNTRDKVCNDESMDTLSRKRSALEDEPETESKKRSKSPKTSENRKRTSSYVGESGSKKRPSTEESESRKRSASPDELKAQSRKQSASDEEPESEISKTSASDEENTPENQEMNHGSQATRSRQRNLDTDSYVSPYDNDSNSYSGYNFRYNPYSYLDAPRDKNYQFYTNQIPSKPDGDLIDNIHKNWWGNYTTLERHHGFIQWLFPLQESGMNYQAQILQDDEIEQIKADKAALQRLRTSYVMMLDFYGMQLKDTSTGEIARGTNWKERFDALNHSFHNYLRITRIIKCLGLLGYEHYQFPFVKFCLREIFKTKTLENAETSCMDYWITAVTDPEKMELLYNNATRLREKYPNRRRWYSPWYSSTYSAMDTGDNNESYHETGDDETSDDTEMADESKAETNDETIQDTTESEESIAKVQDRPNPEKGHKPLERKEPEDDKESNARDQCMEGGKKDTDKIEVSDETRKDDNGTERKDETEVDTTDKTKSEMSKDTNRKHVTRRRNKATTENKQDSQNDKTDAEITENTGDKATEDLSDRAKVDVKETTV